MPALPALSRAWVNYVVVDVSGCLRPRGLLGGTPAQHRLARGGGLVESADARGVRRVQDRVRVFRGLARYLLHGVDELLKLCAADGLRGLDEHRALNDEGEVDGHRVEAVVYESLRDVERVDAFSRLPLVGEEDFVHRRRVEGPVVSVRKAVRDEARV